MNLHPMIRRVTVLASTVALFMLPMQSAFAWTVAGSGNANSFAGILHADAAPSATVSAGEATVSWPAVTFAGSSTAATGYTVNRVWRGAESGPDGQEEGDKEPAGGTCAGTVTVLSCTSPHGTGQTWAYTITPLFAGWIGTESPESTPVTQADAPSVTNITLTNSGTLGQVNVGDSFTIEFSSALDPQSICSGFTSDASGVQTATGMKLIFNGTPNVISVSETGTCGTSNLGTLQVGGSTGSTRYSQGNSISVNSTLAWNPAARTITVTFESIEGQTRTGVDAVTAVYTPGALTAGGIPIEPGTVNSTEQRF